MCGSQTGWVVRDGLQHAGMGAEQIAIGSIVVSRTIGKIALRLPATLTLAQSSFLTDLIHRVDPLGALRYCNMRVENFRRGRPVGGPLARSRA
jgi:hypothetical protein